jgi:hypothetical protein
VSRFRNSTFLKRALQPGDDLGLGSHRLLEPLLDLGRHFLLPDDAQETKLAMAMCMYTSLVERTPAMAASRTCLRA